MTDQRLPNELVLPSIPTAPQPSIAVLEGFAGPTTPSMPSPGVSFGVTRVPTAPTLPDDPTHLTALVASLATELYGVEGGGLGTAPELSSPLSARSTSLPGTPLPSGSPEVPSTASPSTALPSAMPSPAMLAPGSAVPSDVPLPASPTPAPDGSSAHHGPMGTAYGNSSDSNPFSTAPTFDGLFAETERRHPVFTIPLFGDESQSSRPLGEPAVPASGQSLAPEGSALPSSSSASLEPNVDLDLSKGSGFNAVTIRDEFPILRERVHGKRLVWLDNAATTQKPQAVIDRLVHYYEHENSNVHRAAHTLAARSTDAYESARDAVRRFLNARSSKEVVFVRGATEGINLVAQSWGGRYVEAGDEILITWLEHHANIVPWQMLAKAKGARLKVAPVDDDGQIILDEFEKLLTSKTKIVALPQVSNALGTVTPAKAMIDMSHRHGAKVLLDGAQSVSHMRVDLQALDCDFFVFSGHKVFAPVGIGGVVTKEPILEEMPPWQGGGNMIEDVTFERTTFQGPPLRFEAGTGSIADAVGLGAALDWLTRVGLENVERHEHDLLVYGTDRLLEIPGLKIIGTAKEKAGVLSFVLDGHSTADIAGFLDKEGIAVRGGHHCAQPILRRLGKESTVRASLAPYNTIEDLDALVAALWKLVSGQSR